MISLKHHAVSIAAVFLALALGVVLGSQTLASGVMSGLRDDAGDLRHRIDQLQQHNHELEAALAADDGFDTAVSARVLRDVLAQRSIVLIAAPDADPADVDGTAKALTGAGAAVVGRVALSPSFVDPGSADRLAVTLTNMIPAGVQLRTGAVDQGSLAGDFLGTVLQLDPQSRQPQSTPQELTLALDTLRGGGFLGYDHGPVRPGNAIVIVAGDGADVGASAVIARFAGAMRPRGGGVVLAGRGGSAGRNGAVAQVRSDSALAGAVSTVDNVDRAAGRITVALALAEQSAGATGRYGTGPRATSMTVPAQAGR